MKNERRDFLKLSGLGLLAGLLGGGRILTQSRLAFAADKVDPKDPMAVNLGYTADAKKVDTKKWPKRAGADGAKQFCSGCQFYQGDAKSKEAPCTIFAGKLVDAKAWCNTWTKKA